MSSAGESRYAAASAPQTRALLQRRHAENKKYDSEREDHRAAVKFKPGREEEEEERRYPDHCGRSVRGIQDSDACGRIRTTRMEGEHYGGFLFFL